MDKRRNGENPLLDTRADANETVDRALRYKQILEIFDEKKELTAKECAVEMQRKGYIPYAERNFSAPRITELCQKGKLEPIGKKKCRYTGKTVGVYAVYEG